jgi:Tfp pilus assembly protein PilN
MPLHLNLYHEIESQKAASRRDPLKIGGYVLGVVVIIFGVMYFWEMTQSAALNAELQRRKSEFDAIDPKAREAEKREKDLKATFETSEKLVSHVEGRFYWAPVFEQIVKTVPREVQITKLSGNVQGGDGIKKTQINLDGVAAGADPRRAAEDLRQSLMENFGKRYKNVNATFRQLDDGAETVKLDGRSWPTANFAISLSLQDKDQPQATPPPTERKKRRAGEA